MAGLPTGMVMEKRLFQWCPIYVEPIPGSGERIVLAIAVCDGKHDAVVEPVAPIERLPDGWLRASQHAISPLLRALQATLIEHGNSALVADAVLSHGVCLGAVRRAYGIDARKVAQSVSKTTAVLSVFVQELSQDKIENSEPLSHRGEMLNWSKASDAYKMNESVSKIVNALEDSIQKEKSSLLRKNYIMDNINYDELIEAIIKSSPVPDDAEERIKIFETKS